ncbi:MAG: V-type ATPase 116kDa subunit family protein [Candidatus Brocadiia bacterium]
MLSPAQMRKVRIFILARDEQRVTRALGRLGALHLRSSVEESGGELQPEHIEEEVERYEDLLRRVERTMTGFGQGPPSSPPARELPSVEEAEELLDTLDEQTRQQREELEAVETGLEDTELLVERLEPFSDMESSLKRLTESDLLSVTAGRAAPDALQRIRQELPEGALVVPLGRRREEQGARNVLILSGRRRRFAVETALEEGGFEETEVPTWGEQTPADVYREAARKEQELRRRRGELRRELGEMGAGYADALRDAWGALSLQLKFCRARRNFGTTWATTVITGWVPEERVEEVRDRLKEESVGRCMVQVSEPTEEEIDEGIVPTQVDYSGFLGPFQRLVQGYGVASYTEIEPTLLFAWSFLLMFGLVFGDLGHGVLLVAGGLLTRRLAQRDAARDIGTVIAYAGAASAVFGTFFQGSFFGRSLADRGFPLTLGFEPMRFEAAEGAGEHVVRYLVLAVAVGVVLISVGAVLNIVNRLRRGDLEEGLLGHFGVVGIVFYWGALGLVVKLLVAGGGPWDTALLVLLVLMPLAVLVLHRPVSALLRRRGEPGEGVALSMTEGLLDGLETGMVYLANTFSFLRLAAFALSHAALCYTVFVLDRIVLDLPGGPVWAVAVFVIGTALILALEGLIVAIQILRLEYYEFFTKFFRGEGVRYEPFSTEATGDSNH